MSMKYTHTIAKGENLSSIAKKHGLSSWQEIYHNPANKQFRINNPDPNLIHPNDMVKIPENPIVQCEAEIAKIRNQIKAAKEEAGVTKRRVDKEQDEMHSSAKFMLNALDVTADVATMVVGGVAKAAAKGTQIASRAIVKQSIKAIGVGGAAQAAAGAAATFSNNSTVKAIVGLGSFTFNATTTALEGGAKALFKMDFRRWKNPDLTGAKNALDAGNIGNSVRKEVEGSDNDFFWWMSPSGVAEKVAGESADQIRDNAKNAVGSQINTNLNNYIKNRLERIEYFEKRIKELEKQGYSRGTVAKSKI